jgi:AraC-like DNA-binding protein
MRNDILHEPFELVLREFLDVCPRGQHAHNFFELVYIVAGTGKQVINQTEVDYQTGHLFLLAPDDLHSFNIDTPTRFFFIRFNPVYIHSDARHKDLVRQLEALLRNAGCEPGNIIKKPADIRLVQSIMEAIIAEYADNGLYHTELTRLLIYTLLLVIARNIVLPVTTAIDESSDQKIADILRYIQTNIHDPEKLRIERVSAHFGISETYLGRYFRKHAGESYQQYISQYKFKLIENRLLHGNMRINEIADEFGFTDNSHFNRMFKKYKGMNPSEFRKEAYSRVVR